jgi:hypothetical protein
VVGSRMEPTAPARIVYVGGRGTVGRPRSSSPGGVPTIAAVDAPLGYYVREALLPDCRWRMAWRGFDASAG